MHVTYLMHYSVTYQIISILVSMGTIFVDVDMYIYVCMGACMQFVKNSMPPQYYERYNNNRKTPKEVFSDTHKELVKEAGMWLTSTSQSCLVVAGLIATFAFATSTTVPGGTKEGGGRAALEKQLAFKVYAISWLATLCLSVISIMMFLAILTSRYQEKDFKSALPRKLFVGFTSLFVSMECMLITFFAANFFVFRDALLHATFPLCAIICLTVLFYAFVQFPLYFDLVRAAYRTVPQRSYEKVSS